MTRPRTFDQHLAFYVAYSGRVAQLTPASWDRLRLRCTALNGPAFRSLVERALLGARPYDISWLPGLARQTGPLRAIAGVSRAFQTSFAFAYELAAEFDAADRTGVITPIRRTRSTGKPRSDAYIDAAFLIESALIPLVRSDPGVATAVRAAGQAVLRHDWLSPADFDAVYAFVEPEIPFADLEKPFSGTSA